MAVALLTVALPLCAQTEAVKPVESSVHAVSERQAHSLIVGAGDLLEVTVFDSPELSGKLRVNEKGDVTLPIGGALHVEGLTAEGVAAAVEQRLHDSEILKDPHATVLVMEYATQGVTVTGEVKSPGVYPLLGSHGLIDLIAVAGGVTPNAGKAVTILRKSDAANPQIVQLDANPGNAQKANVDLNPGDTVIVSRAGVVYVVGDVTRPGGFLVENNDKLTVLQAIALAQGTNRTASLNSAKLIRKEGGTRQELNVPLKKILANKSADLALVDGDILFVPSSSGKIWGSKGVDAAISLTTGILIYRR